jgi:type I restriction enzyme, R subunit
MRPINSMIEFKQIIGRGTRLFEGKDYFTIYDFVKAYEHFNDREWDGEPQEPVQKGKPKVQDESQQYAVEIDPLEDEETAGRQKIKIKLADGRERSIQHQATTSFWSPDGKPLSAAEFVERLFGDIPELFKNEAELRSIWSRPDTRKALLEGLAERGYGHQELTEIGRLIDAEKSDLYDVLAYIAYATQPISRQARVLASRTPISSRYSSQQQEFLDFVLEQYVREGIGELDRDKLPQLLELKYHAIRDAVSVLGDVSTISNVFIDFQQYLYTQSRAA